MIRDSTPREHAAIRAVLRHTFGRDAEADLVEQLRADGDALVDLVGASDIAVQGHVLYSRLTIERDGATIAAAALAPLAVLPRFQRSGVGTALVEEGNARCRALGVAAIVVLGQPDFYRRFGFSAAAAESLEAPYSGPALMALEFAPGVLQAGGRVRYSPAFGELA